MVSCRDCVTAREIWRNWNQGISNRKSSSCYTETPSPSISHFLELLWSCLGLVSFSGVPVKEEFSLLLPEDVVQDSSRAYFSVLGESTGWHVLFLTPCVDILRHSFFSWFLAQLILVFNLLCPEHFPFCLCYSFSLSASLFSQSSHNALTFLSFPFFLFLCCSMFCSRIFIKPYYLFFFSDISCICHSVASSDSDSPP